MMSSLRIGSTIEVSSKSSAIRGRLWAAPGVDGCRRLSVLSGREFDGHPVVFLHRHRIHERQTGALFQREIPIEGFLQPAVCHAHCSVALVTVRTAITSERRGRRSSGSDAVETKAIMPPLSTRCAASGDAGLRSKMRSRAVSAGLHRLFSMGGVNQPQKDLTQASCGRLLRGGHAS